LDASKKQDNFIVNPFPVAVSLPGTNLFESGAFEATTDVDFPKDILFVYTGNEPGFEAQASKSYFYCTDLANVPSVGWYDANTLAGPYTNADKLVPAGAALIVRKTTGPVGEVAWKAPKPY
jgi:uncharacterized protein (TIGR02597 family)